MTDKHTPGPPNTLQIIGGGGTGLHQYIVDASGRKIGCCWGKAEEKMANALLWAASTQLLAACRIALEAFGDEEDESAEQALADIRDAIAAATEVRT